MTPKEFAAAKHRWIDIVERDHLHVSGMAFRLAFVLARYFNNGTADAWPSQSTLAKDLAVTRRTVQINLDQLVGAGHLIAEMGNGRGNTSRYRPAIKGEAIFTLSCAKGRNSVRERVKDFTGKGEKSFAENLIKEPSLRTLSNRTEYENWLRYYPRQESTEAAKKQYEEIITEGKATHQELIDGAFRYAESVDMQQPQFIKKAANWLKEEGWKDKPTPRREYIDGRI